MKIQSEQEMLDFGKSFAKNLKSPTSEATVIELVGDVGAGKTTFVRGLARGLNINQPITSPSYTISKTYALPDGRILTHYDFYRLPDPGLMVDDLSEKLSDPHQIIIIEWGESIQSLLPPHHHIININYTDENTREVTI